MRTNSKIVRNAVRNTLNNAIDLTGYQMSDNQHNFIKVHAIFTSEYGHEIKRKGERNAFIEWLQGLPSCLNLPFYYTEILQVMETEWQLKQPANKDNPDSAKLYYYLLMDEFLKTVSKLS